MSKSAENMTENLAPCPFCGSRDLSIERFPTLRETSKFHVHCQKCGMAGPSLVSVYCYAGAVLPDLTNAYNSRATTAPKHRPAEVVTGEDADRISKALFNADVCIDHLLPLYATPCNPGRLDGGWEELLNDLLGCDRGELISIFGKVGEHVAAALDDMDKDLPGDAEAEALREVFYQIGGWVIMGSYPTISDITLNEQGRFSSCCVHWGIQRTFVVWGKTYKQAIARALQERRRYRRREVAKAREAAGHGRA